MTKCLFLFIAQLTVRLNTVGFGFSQTFKMGFTCTKPQQGSTHPMKQSRKLIWSVYITCSSCVYTCIFIIRYIISRISPLRTWPRNWWSWRILVRILPTAAFRKHGNIELKQHTASPIQFMSLVMAILKSRTSKPVLCSIPKQYHHTVYMNKPSKNAWTIIM